MDHKGDNFGRALNPQSFTVIDLVQSEGLERISCVTMARKPIIKTKIYYSRFSLKK